MPMKRVQFKFDLDTQVGVSYYNAGLVASFGEDIAKKLEKQKRGKIVSADKGPTKAKAKEVVTDPDDATKSENKMVDTETKPTEGGRTKIVK